MSNDTEYLYRQDSDFWYLTGIEKPDVDGRPPPQCRGRQAYVLFVQPRDPRRES